MDKNKQLCEYSAIHELNGVEAVGQINCGPVGIVPACQACIDFYNENA